MIYRLILLSVLWCSTAHALVFGPIMASSTTYAPSAPVSVSGAAGNGQVVVSWSAGTVDGTHSAATSFNLWRGTSSGGTSLWQSGVTSPYTDTASNGTGYYYKVEAVNSAGNTLSTVAGPYTPTATVYAPNIPVIGTATADNAQASVAFTASVVDGTHSAATSYTATSSPGGLTATGASSPLTVTGLTNGTAYTFTVTATNSAGTSAASGQSNSVTPSAGSYLINDTFTASDGTVPSTTLYNKTNYSGSTSVTAGNTVDITSNKLRMHLGTTGASWTVKGLATKDPISLGSGKTVNVDVTSTASSSETMFFVVSPTAPSTTGRTDDLSNALIFGFNGGNRYVQKKVSGTTTNVVSSASGFGGVTHTYKMVIDTTNVSYYQDGALIGTAAHGLTITNIYVWLETQSNQTSLTDYYFDNLQVY